MKITSKDRENIYVAVVGALDSSAQEENIDEIITRAVLEVVTKIIPSAPETSMALPLAGKDVLVVRYVGKRGIYNDSLFGTGVWERGQAKRVPLAIAAKMFVHTGVYAKGDDDAVESAGPPFMACDNEERDVVEEEKKQEEVEDSLVVLDTMGSKKAVVEFIQANFPNYKIELEKSEKLDAYKELARNLVHQFGLA